MRKIILFLIVLLLLPATAMAARVYANRVGETVTASFTGTGTYPLSGARAGYQSFVDGVGDGNTCRYVVWEATDLNQNGIIDWELGTGTVTDGTPDTITRDSIEESTNGNAAVNWPVGTKYIHHTLSAADIDGFGGDDQTAAEVTYDNASSGLTAVTAQAAIDEVEGRVDTNDAKVTDDDVGVDGEYSSGWNNDPDSPEKDDVYDYLHQFDTDDDGDVDNVQGFSGTSSGVNTGDNPGYDSVDDIPHATPSNGDTTHFPTADEVYDWVIGLGYSVFTWDFDGDDITDNTIDDDALDFGSGADQIDADDIPESATRFYDADGVDAVDDADASATNEINTITGDDSNSTTGLGITIAGGGDVTTSVSGNTVTVTCTNDGYEANTDSQGLDVAELDGTTLKLSLDNDGEATKEIDLSSLQDGYEANTDAQDLTLVGNTLAISGDPNTDVDLSGYLDDTDTNLTEEEVEDFVGGMLGGTETGISVTYQDETGDIDFVVSESDPNALLTAGTDNVKDTHIDWGTGASQVAAVDVPVTDANGYTDETTVEDWLDELDALISAITTFPGWADANDLDASGDVADDSHNHTTTTISGLDISDDTNLAGTANEIVLTDDTLSIHADIARDAEIVTYCETTQNYLKTSENSDSDDDVSAADIGAASDNIAADGTIEWEDAIGLDSDGDLTDEILQDKIGAMLSGNTETDITVTYQDDDGTIDFEVSGGGGATAYDDIADPDASGSITMGAYTGTYTSSTNGWDGMFIENTTADLTSDTTLLTLKYADDGDANGYYLKCIDDSGGTPNVVCQIGDDGDVVTGSIRPAVNEGGNIGNSDYAYSNLYIASTLYGNFEQMYIYGGSSAEGFGLTLEVTPDTPNHKIELLTDSGTEIGVPDEKTITLSENGSAVYTFDASSFSPATDDAVDIGASDKQFKDGFFDGTLEADTLTEGGNAVYNSTEIAAALIDGGGSPIDGDKLEISATWDNITPDTGIAEADSADDLSAILEGIDDALALLGTIAGQVWTGTHDFSGATAIEIENTAGDVTLANGGEIAIDTSQKQFAWHDGTREVAISSYDCIEFSFDPGAWYDSDAEVWLLDLLYDKYPDGIVVYKWYLDANVADPDVEMNVNLMYCDAVAGGAFPGANPTSIDVMDTTAGNSSETDNNNMTANGVVTYGKTIYMLFDADPEGTCTQLHVRIYYYVPES